ncbi:uncharacterized protein LOC106467313, partial [Limulus polyphemus]|uniref:Uncharacterized protein LOC106467313 n=1 Tax=Limulus polyphemus TaxID=6850 RepID=A0ABM1T5M6_LIMPO
MHVLIRCRLRIMSTHQITGVIFLLSTGLICVNCFVPLEVDPESGNTTKDLTCPPGLMLCFETGICAEVCDTTEALICPSGTMYCTHTGQCMEDCHSAETPQCPPKMSYCVETNSCTFSQCDKENIDSIMCPSGTSFCPALEECTIDCPGEDTRFVSCPMGLRYCAENDECVYCYDASIPYKEVCPPGFILCVEDNQCLLECTEKKSSRVICPPGFVFCPERENCVYDCTTDETPTACPPDMVYCVVKGRCVYDCIADETPITCPPDMVYCAVKGRCVHDCTVDETSTVCPPDMVYCAVKGRCVHDCTEDETSTVCPPDMIYCTVKGRCVHDCTEDETPTVCPPYMVYCAVEGRCVHDCTEDETPTVCPPDMVYCAVEGRCVHDCKINTSVVTCPQKYVYCAEVGECQITCTSPPTPFLDCPLSQVYCQRLMICVSEAECYGFDSAAAPVPVSAQFADSLDTVVVRFSTVLQPQKTFRCTKIFVEEELGEGAVCVVTGDNITIRLGLVSSIRPGQTLHLREGNELYDHVHLSTEATGDVIIAEPLNPIPPSFVLYGPSEVCGGEVNITVMSIIGDGAAELTYFWSIFPTDRTSLIDHHKLTKEIEKRKKNLSPRIYSIDSNKLSTDIDYIILASAQNRFQFTSNETTTHRIKRAGSSPLVATILGHYVVSAQKDNTFEANIEMCSGGNLTELEYSWSINSSEFSLAGLKGKCVTLPKGTLRGNNSYNILVTVSLNGSNDFVEAKANHLFSVTMEPLQAIINTCNITVGDSQNFSLDGSRSFDPSNTATDMLYQWFCFLHNSSSECSFSRKIMTNSSVLYIEGGSLKPA